MENIIIVKPQQYPRLINVENIKNSIEQYFNTNFCNLSLFGYDICKDNNWLIWIGTNKGEPNRDIYIDAVLRKQYPDQGRGIIYGDFFVAKIKPLLNVSDLWNFSDIDVDLISFVGLTTDETNVILHNLGDISARRMKKLGHKYYSLS